ncbi:Amino acid transporter, transmembrane [Artemisia annua]|uniref:Amino acid transporter, transmembrane n=1 Tax=Artemisia annua TaxID=35608 RepID=A0A2U1MAG1_ARTAN|nr:Amino acid transporter, transmembrane [Artemisia annua]
MTSFFGFVLFGDSTMGDILSNFETNLGVPFSIELNDIVRVSYALHLMLVFPLVFYALRLNADGLFFGSSLIPLKSDNKRFASISACLLLVIYLGANFIPSVWDAFQFTGATTAVCIGFIFPASIAIRLTSINTQNRHVGTSILEMEQKSHYFNRMTYRTSDMFHLFALIMDEPAEDMLYYGICFRHAMLNT